MLKFCWIYSKNWKLNKTELNIANFKDICRRHCDIIETCLLDYEKYSIDELLVNAANSINQIRLSAKNLQIDNAVRLADNIEKVLSLAIEKRLELFPNDIDIFLRANDLFYAIIQFSYDEIIDLFNSEIAIINELINEINSIAAPYRIKRLSTKKSSVHKNTENTEKKGILLEKFKYALVRSSNEIEQTLQNESQNEKPIDVLPISQALNTIKGAAISAGVSKAFDLADAMQDFIRFLAENNIPINSYQMDILQNCNKLFKEIAASSAIAIIDKIKDCSDYIDSYSDFLRAFLTDQEIVKTPAAKISTTDVVFLNENEAINDIASDGKLYYFGYKSSRNDDFSKYNRMLETTINVIANLVPIQKSLKNLKEIKNTIRQLQLETNNILYNITNTEKITEIALSTAQKLDEIVQNIDKNYVTADEALQDVKNRINIIYSGLYNLRSIAFGDVVRGYNELVLDLANYFKKKISLKISGRFTRIGSETITLLEILLPQLLRYIIMNDIEPTDERHRLNKPETSEIQLSAKSSSGRLFIEITDDGKGEDAKIIAMRLENLINLTSNNQGRFEISSEQFSGSKFRIVFNMNYILMRSLIFQLSNQLYAVQLVDCEALLDEKTIARNYPDFQIIDMRKLFSIETEYVSENRPLLVVKDLNKNYGLLFDKFISEAELVPSPPNKLLARSPYICASSIYNNTPVIILDMKKLINVFTDYLN